MIFEYLKESAKESVTRLVKGLFKVQKVIIRGLFYKHKKGASNHELDAR